jgi:hypothetical protein
MEQTTTDAFGHQSDQETALSHRKVDWLVMPALPPGHLSDKQRNFLCYGPRDAYDDAFADEGQARRAWALHREHILATYHTTRRPWGWRMFDRPEVPWRGLDRERSILWRVGAFTEAERLELEQTWRRDFDDAQRLNGADARRKHLAWADVPRELIKKWNAELRQRGTKKEPAAAATGSDSVSP